MYKALHLSPMIPSYNIRETTHFFTDLFGFAVARSEGNYAIVYKDNLTIHILKAGTDIGEMEFYLEVDTIDSLWEAITDKLTGIHVKAPFDREYGMREFHIEVPHTRTLLFVGQEIKR
jgi:catechol 2,3-dioxygenase-like lactoylglutathione lyase family enzyme